LDQELGAGQMRYTLITTGTKNWGRPLGWFNEKKVKKLFSVPTLKRVELIITVGFSDDDKIPVKNRKRMNEILSYNKYCDSQ
jgi:hypothetical protein